MKARFAGSCVLTMLTAAGASGADADRSRAIYRCEEAGVATFSDRPCGATIQTYADPGRLSVLESVVPTARPDAPVAKPRPPSADPSGPTDRDSKARNCEKLRQSLREVAARMRAGYTAKEGERLRTRKQTLEGKRRAQQC